jgi:hypothetical protein
MYRRVMEILSNKVIHNVYRMATRASANRPNIPPFLH